MKTRILLLILAILSNSMTIFSQVQKSSNSVRKFKNVALLGFTAPQAAWNERDKWIYVFHIKHTKGRFEFGKELTPYTNEPLICTDEAIGKPLIEQKDKWLNHRVNIYYELRDYGLTPHMNVGFVTKIELLDGKGKIVKTIK